MSIPKKPRISLPVIVEGKYDKIKLSSLFSCTCYTTEGFGIFNSPEKIALIRRIAGDRGVIILTDSDGGGKQIRRFLSGILPKDKVYQLFIPKVEGKERRKNHRSKEGLLGVEGVNGELLMGIFAPFISDFDEPCEGKLELTAADLFSLRLTGYDDSQTRRDLLATRLMLPSGMSSKAFLCAVNLCVSKSQWDSALGAIEQ